MKTSIVRCAGFGLLFILSSCNPSPDFATYDPAQRPDSENNINNSPNPTSTPDGNNENTPNPTASPGPTSGGTTTPTPIPTSTSTPEVIPTVEVTVSPTPTITPTVTITPTISPTPTSGSSRTFTFDITTTSLKPTTDVLFIVDDSGSMADEQTYLSNGVRNMVNSLAGNNVNFYVYTTSNDGAKNITNSNTLYTPNQVAPYSALESFQLKAPFHLNGSTFQIRDSDTLATINQVSTNLTQSITNLGTTGSGREQGTCSMLRAIHENGVNKVFKAGNYAAIVLISDENDSTSLNNCYYQRSWDVDNNNQILNTTYHGFPQASNYNDLQLSFVEKANQYFGQDRYVFSAIIHDQVENQKIGCGLTSGASYGTKYRDLANLITHSGVYSICQNDYSPALAPVNQFIQSTTATTYAINLNAGETITKVELYRNQTYTELVANQDYTIHANNIEFLNYSFNSNDQIRVTISN